MVEVIVNKGEHKGKIVKNLRREGDLFYCKLEGCNKKYKLQRGDLEIIEEMDKYKEITLNRCPHCGDDVEIKCKSILGEKVLVNQFYKYFNWHLENECYSKEHRKVKKIKVTVRSKKEFFTSYDWFYLFV